MSSSQTVRSPAAQPSSTLRPPVTMMRRRPRRRDSGFRPRAARARCSDAFPRLEVVVRTPSPESGASTGRMKQFDSEDADVRRVQHVDVPGPSTSASTLERAAERRAWIEDGGARLDRRGLRELVMRGGCRLGFRAAERRLSGSLPCRRLMRRRHPARAGLYRRRRPAASVIGRHAIGQCAVIYADSLGKGLFIEDSSASTRSAQCPHRRARWRSSFQPLQGLPSPVRHPRPTDPVGD